MKERKNQYADRDLDRLLGARVRAPSDQFEDRLERMMENLAEGPGRVVGFPHWASWFAAAASVAAILAIGLFFTGVVEREDQLVLREAPSYEELFVLEEDVGAGLSLTDPQIVDAILNMPTGAES